MGDRATLAVVASYPTRDSVTGLTSGARERYAVYCYCHWTGEDMPERVRVALQRGKPRYGAPMYLTRILVEAVIVHPGTLDGYALGPRPLDTEPGRPVLVVDLDKRTVGVAELDRGVSVPKVERSISWAEYVGRAPREWGRGLLAV